jgi:hypothetical protein
MVGSKALSLHKDETRIKSGSTKANGREIGSCLGRIVDPKLDTILLYCTARESNAYSYETLTEGEGSVQLTSTLR